MNDGLIHPSFEDVCHRQAQWIEELEGKVVTQAAEIERVKELALTVYSQAYVDSYPLHPSHPMSATAQAAGMDRLRKRDPIQCLNCGTFFVPKRTTKKFCSTGRCRQEYHERSKGRAS